MTLMDQIQERISQLPPEKQGEVLDFIAFLQQRSTTQKPAKQRSLKDHPAFGSWRGRKINALKFQQNLRSEWDERL
jgi:hypothetical protein